MLDGLRPDMVCRDVISIDLDALERLGVRALMFDLDNTLARWNSFDVVPGLRKWLYDCRARGFAVCICSNNHAPRVRPVAEALGMDYIADAGKPASAAYRRACRLLNAAPECVAAVGDQLLTDVFGAKRNGLRAVLVNPIGGREFVGTYVNRALERPVMRLMGVRRAR
ncbi:MAG TPA: YqeG family HAD IIIA-type phosphatase [Candidatus Fimadaptatus faecigallinarum]|uniref:YqeG family HAD IIIA-type phosphatase n=1 Tax=Candidatus Fimadaptatus faecigallinarum TaxID=2840814 RepID=A0A9D1LR71_9FIRM|nr:YqeG family HAD IIIA-type phosphatase [Candidatus Fimadaptatus faecigallinarum]